MLHLRCLLSTQARGVGCKDLGFVDRQACPQVINAGGVSVFLVFVTCWYLVLYPFFFFLDRHNSLYSSCIKSYAVATAGAWVLCSDSLVWVFPRWSVNS